MNRVGLLPNIYKQESISFAFKLSKWLEERGIEVRFLEEDAPALKVEKNVLPRKDFAHGLDLVVSLGGDGTVLRAAQIAYPHKLPLLGVNLGKLGFLTALDKDNVFSGMEEVLAGNYLVQKRRMLECGVVKGEERERHFALNEVVVGKRMLQRMIKLEVYINGEYFNFYSGDGLIFATPTGSTAYSLASGGPIIEPKVDCFILTPICSHSLMARSVILSHRDRVMVRISSPKTIPSLSIDGREEIDIDHDYFIHLKLSGHLRLVKLSDYSFFRLIREKFKFPEN